MKNFNHLILLFVLGLFSWIIAYPLMQDGMFTDGIQYASVSRNLALGLGTFWDPHFSTTMFNHFHQQPPLMFGLQSIFFRVIGDSIYPERIYCLVLGTITMILIAQIWKELNPNQSVRKMSWLPLFLWLITPTVSWGMINNVEENTMVVFDLLSVWTMIRLFNHKNEAISFFCSAIFLFLATLTKGIQGLFPLVVPFYYWFTQQNLSFKKMVLISFLFIGSITTIYSLMLLNPDAREGYQQYFESRFKGFPETPNVTTSNRLYLLGRLFIELIAPICFCCLLVLFIRTKNFFRFLTLQMKRNALLFFLVGLSASIPLMISFEQRDFYLITSIPFFVIALSFLLAPSLKNAIENLNERFRDSVLIQFAVGLFLLSGIAFASINAGNIKRDQDMLHDVYLLKNLIGINQNVSVSEKTWNNWALQNYFQRYDNISVLNNTTECSYYLQPQKDGSMNLPGFQKVEIGTIFFDVYKKQ